MLRLLNIGIHLFQSSKSRVSLCLLACGTLVPTQNLSASILISSWTYTFWTMYGVILKLSENKTKAYVKTKKNPGGIWHHVKLLYPLAHKISTFHSTHCIFLTQQTFSNSWRNKHMGNFTTTHHLLLTHIALRVKKNIHS